MKKITLIIMVFIILMPLVLVRSAVKTASPVASPAPAAEKPPILETGGMLMLVNAGHRVSKVYVPEDLLLPKVATRKDSLQENILMRKEAAEALEVMFEAALKVQNYTLYAASGYRSFGIQQILFNTKVEEVGSREKAQRRVAPAGTSEHQLGLAIDIQAPSQLNLSQAFGSTEEGKWAGENAHRFGYILRYKKQWSDITGISDEPWHFRYVGIAHSTAIYQLDIPLETYVEYAAQLPGYVLTGGSHVLLSGLIADLKNGIQPARLELLHAAIQEEQDAMLRLATLPYLTDGLSYEQALWYAYPTPKPTAAPWVDIDDEVEIILPSSGGA